MGESQGDKENIENDERCVCWTTSDLMIWTRDVVPQNGETSGGFTMKWVVTERTTKRPALRHTISDIFEHDGEDQEEGGPMKTKESPIHRKT